MPHLIGVTDCLACNSERMSPGEAALAVLATAKRFGVPMAIGELCASHRRQFEHGYGVMENRETLSEAVATHASVSQRSD